MRADTALAMTRSWGFSTSAPPFLKMIITISMIVSSCWLNSESPGAVLQLLWSSKALNLIFILETERFDRVKVQTEWLLSHRVEAERFDQVKLLPQRVQTQWLVSHWVEADWLRRVKLNRGRIKTRRFGGVQAESVQVFHFPLLLFPTWFSRYFFPLLFPTWFSDSTLTVSLSLSYSVLLLPSFHWKLTMGKDKCPLLLKTLR